jgi:hypothetical protein
MYQFNKMEIKDIVSILFFVFFITIDVFMFNLLNEKIDYVISTNEKTRILVYELKNKNLELQKSIDTLNIKIGFVKTINHIRIVDSNE